ncbi:MAG: hypothetical protein QOJ26_1676, partial [Thermoplasmata archaeon]|nr:hypothetical protein [Thermoplasmata archaeon]
MPAKPAKAGKAAKSPKPAKSAKAKPRKAAPPAKAPRKPARPRAQPAARAEPAPAPDAWTEAPAEAPPAPLAVGVVPWSTPATPAGAWGGFSTAVDPRTLPLRPVKGLAGALVVLLACSVGLTAVNLLFEFLVKDWGRPSAGAGVSVLQGILNALSSGASIALIIVFCMWLYRVLR